MEKIWRHTQNALIIGIVGKPRIPYLFRWREVQMLIEDEQEVGDKPTIT